MALAPQYLPVLIAALPIAATVVACLVDRRQHRHALAAAKTERDQARTGEAEAVRVLRLAAIELRGPATILLGHADRLCAEDADIPAVEAIGAIAQQMLDLADDLQHHALADATRRVLRDEPIRLAGILQDAVAAVQAGLEPGWRHWRLPPELGAPRFGRPDAGTSHIEVPWPAPVGPGPVGPGPAGPGPAGHGPSGHGPSGPGPPARGAIYVIADRRALAQILARVLGSAARFSHHDDWIDIGFELAGDRFVLIVADEGNGLVATDRGDAPSRADSRGLGFGLALARVLMEAHGGALRVEAVPSVGTRVTLDFPLSQLVRAASPPASVGMLVDAPACAWVEAVPVVG